MFKISNFTDNDDVTVLKEFGAFKTIEWKRDLSVNEASAMNAYFASEMNVRRRQVICDLSQAPVTVQAGAMQWMVGNVTCTTGVKGVGDLFGKDLVAFEIAYKDGIQIADHQDIDDEAQTVTVSEPDDNTFDTPGGDGYSKTGVDMTLIYALIAALVALAGGAGAYAYRHRKLAAAEGKTDSESDEE